MSSLFPSIQWPFYQVLKQFLVPMVQVRKPGLTQVCEGFNSVHVHNLPLLLEVASSVCWTNSGPQPSKIHGALPEVRGQILHVLRPTQDRVPGNPRKLLWLTSGTRQFDQPTNGLPAHSVWLPFFNKSGRTRTLWSCLTQVHFGGDCLCAGRFARKIYHNAVSSSKS